MMVSLDQQLYNAINLATYLHNGQLDKAGEPYILHPLRTLARTRNRKEQIVALLHDIVEDTYYKIEHLRKHGFSDDIIEAIDYLTRKEGETYNDFIERISENELAAKVKLLDLEDNMDLNRLSTISNADLERTEKYKNAYMFLYKVIYKDNINEKYQEFQESYNSFIGNWKRMYNN